MIAVGIVSVLSVLTLRDDLAGAAGTDAATRSTVGKSLVAFHDATFLLVWRSAPASAPPSARLPDVPVRPRAAAYGAAGLVGGPLGLLAATAVLFGAWEQTLRGRILLHASPRRSREASLAIYLIVKGFKTPSPILEETRESALDEAFSPDSGRWANGRA